MNSSQASVSSHSGLTIITVLFAILLLAQQGNELLKQLVLIPGSAAELSIPANCRADELEEESLSLQECQLMVSNVQIVLASSPSWFRSFQLGHSTLSSLVAVMSFFAALTYFASPRRTARLLLLSFALLVLLDVFGFIAAMNTGPLLRAQYLWPLTLWFFIHLCLLIASLTIAQPRVTQEASQS